MSSQQPPRLGPIQQQLAKLRSNKQQQRAIMQQQAPVVGMARKKRYSLVRSFQKNLVFKVIVAVGVLLAFLAGLITNISTIQGFIGTIFFPPDPKLVAAKNVEGLVPGVDISLYEDKFGKPAFINQRNETKYGDPNEKNLKEFVFVNPYFYLDAVIDMNGKVLFFAVTTRDKSFNPIFRIGCSRCEPGFQITLGVSRYIDVHGSDELTVGGPPAGVAEGCFGANQFDYYETRYFGRPADYEFFGFGFNQAGYHTEDTIRALSGLEHRPDNCHGVLNEQELAAVGNFRAKTAFNTYAISLEPIYNLAGFILGADYNQVGTLGS